MYAPPHQLPHCFFPTPLPHRHRPAEYLGNAHAWVQDERKVHKVKPSYAYIWPKDGKRGNALGRMRDIFAGKGPDIHLSISADKRDHMFNRQRRAIWSNWTSLDDHSLDGAISSQKYAPWTQMAMLGGRGPGAKYDFRTRRYGVPNQNTWTDAVWQSNADKYKYPEAFRTVHGTWCQDEKWLPWQRGGPSRNDIGRDIRI